MRWYHLVVLICISLIISDTEHVFINRSLLAICMSSLEKLSIQFLCPPFDWIVWGWVGINWDDGVLLILFFHSFYYCGALIFFLFFWLCWVFVAVLGFSLVAASGDCSSLRYMGFSLCWLLLLQTMGSRRVGSVVVAHGLCSLMACGIFPDQGLNPCPLHWQVDS